MSITDQLVRVLIIFFGQTQDNVRLIFLAGRALQGWETLKGGPRREVSCNEVHTEEKMTTRLSWQHTVVMLFM